MKYTVSANVVEALVKKLNRFERKANKLGKQLQYTISDKYVKTIDVVAIDYVTQTKHVVDAVNVIVVDVELDAELIRMDGWKVCAYLEHMPTGNIVTVIDVEDKEASLHLDEWRSVGGNCEHCHYDRNRTYTFIIKHEDGTYKQVGKTCLKEYTGIDVGLVLSSIALNNEVLPDTIDKDTYCTLSGTIAYDVERVLAYACKSIRENGYNPVTSINGNTKMEVIARLDKREELTDKDVIEAKAVMEYTKSYEGQDEFINNGRVLIEAGFCKLNHIGRLAYLPVAVGRVIQKQLDVEEGRKSQHIGTVGQRIELDVVEYKVVSSFDNAYGTTYIQVMKDVDGNEFVWFGSKTLGKEVVVERTGGYNDLQWVSFESGKVKATIKKHDVRNGIKQTILTRCKVIK